MSKYCVLKSHISESGKKEIMIIVLDGAKPGTMYDMIEGETSWHHAGICNNLSEVAETLPHKPLASIYNPNKKNVFYTALNLGRNWLESKET